MRNGVISFAVSASGVPDTSDLYDNLLYIDSTTKRLMCRISGSDYYVPLQPA